MKRILLVLATLFVYTYQAQGQEIREIKEEVESHTICLLGYLYVFPKDLGSFDHYPADVINSINKVGAYGRKNWRLPTWTELQLLRSDSHRDKTNVDGITRYMYTKNGYIYYLDDDFSEYGFQNYGGEICKIRLVSTD